MPRIVKKEPKPHDFEIAASRAFRQSPDNSELGTESAFDAKRGARSGAPSIATRRPPPTIKVAPSDDGSHEGSTEVDDDCVILKEVKTAPQQRTLANDRASGVTQSFMAENKALKDFGRKLKGINDALAELQALGIQHVANLPELVLVGDQSSGKSSLMSAIAGLSLPRAAGTCTRCPIHIRISRADEPSCRVFIKRDYSFVPTGKPITVTDVTKKNPFPPWVKLDPAKEERLEFKSIRDTKPDPEDIENVLRCAQIAILNPSTPCRQFVPKLSVEAPEEVRQEYLHRIYKYQEKSEAQFSPNTVAIEVKGPDLPDLNFYDLPGVFMAAKRDEDKFLEKVVQNLANEYMSRPNAIIIWAVPMNQDAENSFAFRLIRDRKAENRCVGVMTKADLLPPESPAALPWVKMLKGENHPTGLGYFITSRQGKDLDSQTPLEEAFFNGRANGQLVDSEWPSIFKEYHEKCGVERLKVFLSETLGREFATVLPEVKEKVNNLLYDVDQQLRQYPDPPAHPEIKITRSLMEFSGQVKARVRDQMFQSQWDVGALDKLREAILGLKPRYMLNAASQPAARSATPAVITIDDSEPIPTPAPHRKRPAPANPATPDPKRQRAPPPAVKKESVDTPPRFSAPSPLHRMRPSGAPARTLETFRLLIQRHSVPGQPGLVSQSVYEPLYVEAAQRWAPHLDRFVDRTFAFIGNQIKEILNQAFSEMRNREVYRLSDAHIHDLLASWRTELHEQLVDVYHLEARRLFTKDEKTLERHKAAELKVLIRHRNHYRIAAHNNEEPAEIPSIEALTPEQLAKEAVDHERKLRSIGPDEYEQELNVMAYVRGYYLTAAHRFVDHVAMRVMAGLLPRIESTIDIYLMGKLGLIGGPSTAEVYKSLMEEGAEIAEKRADLQSERKKYEKANDIIINLQKDDQSEGSLLGEHHTNGDGGSPSLGRHSTISSGSHASTINGET